MTNYKFGSKEKLKNSKAMDTETNEYSKIKFPRLHAFLK